MLKFSLFLFAIPLSAQLTSGSISGYVLDPSHKPVPRATVTTVENGLGIQRRTTADDTGFYVVTDLAPANYTITVSAAGFQPSNARHTVAVDSRSRLDIVLSIDATRQSIEVIDSASLLNEQSSELGTVLDRRLIDGMPLNRRDFLQLSLLTPGVLPPVQASELSSRGGFAMHANGAREEFNHFLLDGVDNSDQYENTYLLQPSVDSIQEFKIVTNGYSAEYGRNAGAQVNVVTRSGGSQWHGGAWEYLRNRDLDARNFFDGADKPGFIRNQFGGGVGGPVWGDRSFVYGNVDELREKRGVTQLANVPTLAQRASIPASRISNTAAQLLNLYPLPNLPGSAGNYLGQPAATEVSTQVNGRFDRRLSGTSQLTLRYSHGDQDVFEPYTHGGSIVPGFGDYVTNTGHNAMIHYQASLGPRTFESLHVAFNRSFRNVLPENYRTDVGRLWNVPWLNVQPRDFGYPLINVTGFSPVGDQTQIPINRYTNTVQIVEGVTLVRGSSVLRIGGEMRNTRLNGALDYFARGQLTFSGAITGSGISDLLLGFPSFAIQAQFDNPQTLRTTAYNAYIQDDWKIRENLTLNLGLRYEYNTPPTDPYDRMAVLDLASGTEVNVGTHGIPRSGIRPDRNNFAPRVGFSWMPAAKLVVRGAYGLYYDAGMLVVNSSLYFNPPYFNIHAWFPTAANLLTLNNPFPTDSAITPPPSPNTLSPDLTTSYLQHWNMTVERQFGRSTVARIAYAGSKGTHLIRSRDLNQPLPAPGPVASRRPLPAFSGIFFIESGGNSDYHSLQLFLERRFDRRFSVLAAYTFSKSIDDTSAFLGTQPDKNFPQNSHDIGAERALSSFDMRHRLTVAGVYQLPYRFEARYIATAESGQPFTPYLQVDNSNTGNSGGVFGLDRPDLLGDPKLADPTPERWFDTSAFAIPARYHFGTAGRNILTGPAFVNFDLALSRRFVLRDRLALTFDAQSFNLLNTAHFDLPQAFADSPATFGRIFSAKAPRQIQFAVRLSF